MRLFTADMRLNSGKGICDLPDGMRKESKVIGVWCGYQYPMISRFIFALFLFSMLPSNAREAPFEDKSQYILVNVGSPNRETLEQIRAKIPAGENHRVRLGFSSIFRYFGHRDENRVLDSLKRTLALSEELNLPFYIQLDGEVWWQGRPDLWNWWDKDLPGYNPENRKNVEWFSWSSEDAVKISWLDWGRQIRMAPTPNLLSPDFRAASHEQMGRFIPVILDWAEKLPVEKKDLFVGIKVGWESSIGVHQFYYPGGNELLDKPASEDPTVGSSAYKIPSRGATQLGYAALKSSGIRTEGEITESDLVEVIRRHLEDLSKVAGELGMPREKIFTHSGGWIEGEELFKAAVNRWSCPGWSFYRHASDPRKDKGVQAALELSDAPYWAATEWLYLGPRTPSKWRSALETTLAAPKCRLICIFNWSNIIKNPAALEAIRQVVNESRPARR